MKVIAIERMWSERLTEMQTMREADRIADPSGIAATVIADSAIVRVGMPLFLPDFATDWCVEFEPAVVISRLGKSIPARFAPRYYNRIGVMGRLMPPGGYCGGALAASFDGALCAGPTVEAGEGVEWTVSIDGREELTLGRDNLLIDETIALVSRYMMLKTGDVILPCRSGLQVKAAIGERLTATLNGCEHMILKIK